MEILILVAFKKVENMWVDATLALPLQCVSIWKEDGIELVGMKHQNYLCHKLEDVYIVSLICTSIPAYRRIFQSKFIPEGIRCN
jgi:hypothetical protein